MLDRWQWGTGCSWCNGWLGTLVSDRVSAISSLLIVGRKVDDEARVLGSALCPLMVAYLQGISTSFL
jgi:hypothetical protein